MQTIEFTKGFRKAVRKWRKSGKGMEPLEEFVDVVRTTWPPPVKYEAHTLGGSLEGVWDIHLRQNWVLLLSFNKGTIRFLRMGTHAELGL